MFVNGKQIYNFKADNKNVDFPTQFCLRSIYKKFGAIDSREVSLEEKVHDISVDYNAIDKPDILNIHRYLLFINDI